MKHKMTEKNAIVIAAVLGIAVLALLFQVWSPLVWGPEEKEKPAATASGETVSASGSAVQTASGAGIQPGATENPSGKTIATRIAVPDGYTRVEAPEDSFAAFVRNYPLKKAGSKVKLYNGERKDNQEAHEAVFQLPIENEDLQQCADSVMRMYAEYFWETGQYERISFLFADGFQAEYTKWREGFRIQPGDTETVWVGGNAPYDDSYNCYKKFMRMVFAYAGTTSMQQESKKIGLKKMQVGDIFLQSGSPGHVVMVADVCENEQGQKAFLLAQGYMPAQEFQLLKNPAHEESPWYFVEEVTGPLETPEYTFKKGTLRRPRY